MNYYTRVSKAIQHYQDKGYKWIDTPWYVNQEAFLATYPGTRPAVGVCDLGFLVGSAEQGFIQLMQRGDLLPGKYVSAGPCFRFEDLDRPFHHPYFFKVELIVVGSRDYQEMLYDAKEFLGGVIINTTEGLDLQLGGLEIGSYGYRVVGDLVWAYGTGLAEPRYSDAKELAVRGW